MSGALTQGRALTSLDPSKDGEGTLYAAELADDGTFERRRYRHCTFANVSFLKARLDNCEFVNCAFLDCYFRRTEMRSSVFTGCKFEDCFFGELDLEDCTFAFPQFRGCYIQYDEFRLQLPPDPGMRFRIADELGREAGSAGQLSDARRYRLDAAAAWEDHLKNIALASGGDYYKTHFDLGQRLDAVPAWIWRKINRFLWGYGERGWILARSFALVALLVYPLIFWVFLRSNVHRGATDAMPLRTIDYELFSLDNVLNRTGFSAVGATGTAARLVLGSEVLVGLLFIGLFIAVIFNWMRRR